MTDLVLGIDTGGTYTDGALLDYETRQIVDTTKTLTTHHDLKICIQEALDNLLPADPSAIRLVSISTTLATNAIAEGKGRPVGLFLLGYDPDLVASFQFQHSFATTHFHYFKGGHTLHGEPQAPLDVEGIVRQAEVLQNEVEAFAISGYFSPFNASHEEAARQALAEAVDQPVVLGHQLSMRLNSIQRATTASLNASLLSILEEFLAAMRATLDQRGVTAPLMVVHGDGGLMEASAAAARPVETVHSGPAASAIGGRFLAGVEQALVVDIGGTTTDLAILEDGQVTIREEGTTVGRYNTAVRAANVHSIGLGGDSLIAFNVEGDLEAGPARVVPISYLAHTHPTVADDLKHVVGRLHRRPTPDQVEYWFFQREPRRFIEDERTQAALDLLRQGPIALPVLLERLGLFHELQFAGRRLVQEGIVGRAALTPTDLLHLTGEFAPWEVNAARQAASLIARLNKITVDQLIARTKRFITERIVEEIVSFITGQTLKRVPSYVPFDDLGLWLFEENLYHDSPHLGNQISLKMPIVGIGAPAGIFLPPVAELLQTDLILPEHHAVANAVGAVAGSVMLAEEVWVLPDIRDMHVVGYYVRAGADRSRFRRLEEALAYAQQTARERALEKADAAGAIEPHVRLDEVPTGESSFRVRATAVGSPRLGQGA
jgi:N-methylhydantoinase A/oxoprolinase/acetone carboxylase beta subunit